MTNAYANGPTIQTNFAFQPPTDSVDFSTDTPGPYDPDTPPRAPGAPAPSDGAWWTRFQEQAGLLRSRVPGLFAKGRGVRLMTEVGAHRLRREAMREERLGVDGLL